LTSGLPSYLLFLGNWSETAVPSAVRILWSVCVEEQFYVLFPICLALAGGRLPALRPIAAGLLVAWAMRAHLVVADASPGTIYKNTFARGDALLLGALLAQLLHARPEAVQSLVRRAGGWGELAALTACFSFTLIDFRAVAGVGWLLYYFTSALIGTSIVALFAFGEGPLKQLLSRSTLRWLGGLTYAGYVFHMYAVAVSWALVRRFVHDPWYAAITRSALAIVLTFVIAFLSKILIERRFLEMKYRFQPFAGVTPNRVEPGFAVLKTVQTEGVALEELGHDAPAALPRRDAAE
jgi:peptidoglycan/LPS O-acetylase OafA/YrhL